MSQTLNIRNFNSLNIIAKTNLTADIAAGVNSLPIQSSSDFVAGPILLGAPGSPFVEMATITLPNTASALPVTGVTKQPHNFGDNVYMLFGDHIKVYSATDQYGTGQQPDDSHFALITGGNVAIDASQIDTSLTDPAGTSGMWYKYTYFNSVTSSETQLSDSNAVQVGKTHYVSIDQVRAAAGFSNNKNITDDLIAEFINAAEKEINGALLPVYIFPLPIPTNPIIVEIAKQMAAGQLMHEQYVNVSEAMASMGETKADLARHGGGSHTSLDELVTRAVVLEDANFNELTISEGHGFGGWPDNSTETLGDSGGMDDDDLNDTNSSSSAVSDADSGGDEGHIFYMDKLY